MYLYRSSMFKLINYEFKILIDTTSNVLECKLIFPPSLSQISHTNFKIFTFIILVPKLSKIFILVMHCLSTIILIIIMFKL